MASLERCAVVCFGIPRALRNRVNLTRASAAFLLRGATPRNIHDRPLYRRYAEWLVDLHRTHRRYRTQDFGLSLMKHIVTAAVLCCAVFAFGARAGQPGSNSTASAAPIAAPKDRPYPGQISVAVDASDLDRRIVHVHETLSGVDNGTVLLYPK